MSRPAGQALRVEVLTTIEQLQQVVGPWRDLWQQATWATPFQTPEWLLPWCRCWAEGGVHVLLLWQGESLVGLVPWRIDIANGQRRALLLGAGLSDYLDALVAPGCEQTVAAAMFAHISELRSEVDVWQLAQLAPDGFLARSLGASDFADQQRAGAACPVLPLDGQSDNLAEYLPNSQYKKLQYYRRRLVRSGTASYESAEHHSFSDGFSALVRLHATRWNDRDQAGVLDDSLILRFHREAAAGLLQQQLLRLYTLRLDGRPIASFYGFHAHCRAYYYLGGFDPACGQLSPGMLIIGHAIEQSLQQRAKAFDFLRGQESYKYSWGSVDRRTYAWQLSGASA